MIHRIRVGTNRLRHILKFNIKHELVRVLSWNPSTSSHMFFFPTVIMPRFTNNSRAAVIRSDCARHYHLRRFVSVASTHSAFGRGVGQLLEPQFRFGAACSRSSDQDPGRVPMLSTFLIFERLCTCLFECAWGLGTPLERVYASNPLSSCAGKCRLL